MEIIELYNKYTIEIITITCIICFFFGGKIIRKLRPEATKKNQAYWGLYRCISRLWYAATDNTLDQELENLKVFFWKNKEYISHEVQEIYHEIYDRFYDFETWKYDIDKSIKVTEQNSVSMKKLENLIISETSYRNIKKYK